MKKRRKKQSQAEVEDYVERYENPKLVSRFDVWIQKGIEKQQQAKQGSGPY
jgi:hypothetical protein